MVTFKNDTTTILDDVTEGTVQVGPERAMDMRHSCFYVVFSDGSTGGSVVIETAHRQGYEGDWAPRALVRWVKGHRAHYVGVTGLHLALRVRVVDPIQHGTVSVFGAGTKG